MNSTRAGSPDGLVVHTFVAGETYDLSGDLLSVFLGEGWAEGAAPDEAYETVNDIPQSTPIELPGESMPEFPVANISEQAAESKNPRRRRK